MDVSGADATGKVKKATVGRKAGGPSKKFALAQFCLRRLPCAVLLELASKGNTARDNKRTSVSPHNDEELSKLQSLAGSAVHYNADCKS
jgi:hypothetical protein